MLKKQTKLVLSNFSEIYDLIIPKDNLLRQILNLIDFEFVYDELKDKYSETMGRNAISPIVMFKYLLLKQIYKLSDVGVVERATVDMSFKFFLGLSPEEGVIESSSLTKFRRQRLKDINLLDMLIGKTVDIALEKGIIKSKTIIVDSTHTKARYNQFSPHQALQNQSKKLRKSVYKIDDSIKNKFPKKHHGGILEEEIKYSKKLIKVIRNEPSICNYPFIKEELNLLEEIVEDDINQLKLSKDTDAKVGHKTADTAFFGYKTHIAMSEERIITSAVVTTGEKTDGKQLVELVRKSRNTGMVIEEIIGDAAYSEKDNIIFANDGKIKLISKLSKAVTHGGNRLNKFDFNKDASMYVCPQGHMAIKKTSTRPKKHKIDGKGTVETYFFDVEKCKVCPSKKGCYKEGSKSKSYSVSIKTNIHKKQMDFQNTDYFKTRAKERYMIEAKNSELKHNHGFDIANSHGLFGMNLQAAVSIFAVNLKRIIKLS